MRNLRLSMWVLKKIREREGGGERERERELRINILMTT
jgi:hypothetical protein